jgi:hypothetical protein
MGEVPVVHETYDVSKWWQIKAVGVEWYYVLQKLKDSVVPPAGIDHCVTAHGFDNVPVYLLSRKFYGPDVISKATGLPVDKLTSYKGIITLRSAPVEGLPEPNLDQWGTA